jgi:hypothetical protein
MIENHAIFGSDHQLPCEIQLAIFLNHAGHYGNAATIQDIADWAGISMTQTVFMKRPGLGSGWRAGLVESGGVVI